MARPSASTQQDDFVGRMLWALSHASGLPAKRFAEFDPVPPLDWLDALSKVSNSDIVIFHALECSRSPSSTGKLRFSLVRRPTPYMHAPRMRLISSGPAESDWDDVLLQLARWLIRHLDDPTLVLWMVERGGQLHDRMVWLIEGQLDLFGIALSVRRRLCSVELARILRPGAKGNTASATPDAVAPASHGEREVGGSGSILFRWKDRLKREGLSTSLRLQLRAILAPKIALRKPIRWPGGEASEDTPGTHACGKPSSTGRSFWLPTVCTRRFKTS